MKTLSELGISPWPWECHKQSVIAEDGSSVVAANNLSDARLIAAAPELLLYLQEAVLEMCYNCKDKKCKYKYSGRKCSVFRWRKVVDRASGESEVK